MNALFRYDDVYAYTYDSNGTPTEHVGQRVSSYVADDVGVIGHVMRLRRGAWVATTVTAQFNGTNGAFSVMSEPGRPTFGTRRAAVEWLWFVRQDRIRAGA